MTEREPSPDCACPHFERYHCANMRHRRNTGAFDEAEPCDCDCHNDYDDEADAEDAGDFLP